MGQGYLVGLWSSVSLLLTLKVTGFRCSGLCFHLCWIPGCCGFVPVMISDSCWKLVKVKAGSAALLAKPQAGLGALWRSSLAGTTSLSRDLASSFLLLTYPCHFHIVQPGGLFLKGLNLWLWHIELITFRLTNIMESLYWLILNTKIYRDTQLPNSFQFENKTSSSQLSSITIAFSSSI